MGRPQVPIDAEQVQKLAALGCKTKEIAEWFECSEDTITRRFAAEMLKGFGELKQSLRRAQIKNALNGNATMQIWLGKQYLGQAEVDAAVVERLKDPAILAEIKNLLKLRDE